MCFYCQCYLKGHWHFYYRLYFAYGHSVALLIINLFFNCCPYSSGFILYIWTLLLYAIFWSVDIILYYYYYYYYYYWNVTVEIQLGMIYFMPSSLTSCLISFISFVTSHPSLLVPVFLSHPFHLSMLHTTEQENNNGTQPYYVLLYSTDWNKLNFGVCSSFLCSC
jgi:hypothetical protein